MLMLKGIIRFLFMIAKPAIAYSSILDMFVVLF